MTLECLSRQCSEPKPFTSQVALFRLAEAVHVGKDHGNAVTMVSPPIPPPPPLYFFFFFF